MKRSISVFILVLVLITSFAHAQQKESPAKSAFYLVDSAVRPIDTTSLLSAVKRGHFSGHARYFFMATQNANGLTNYFANAAGARLHFETAFFHGFQLGLSGEYSFNIASSDLAKADTVTGQYNRYEIGLFDMEDPSNKLAIHRLVESYLNYHFKNTTITAGRQLINTPFINEQDGRMTPTAVAGIWVDHNKNKKAGIEGGWLYGISPRSTTKWYGTGESIGINPAGVNINGSRSGYKNNLASKAVFIIGIHAAINKAVQLHAWDVYAGNILNTVMLQADATFPLKDESAFFTSVQGIRQDAVNNGGNPDPAKTYVEKGGKALTFGAKAGWKNKQWETSLNYNRITNDGRYLMPREWGREPFFTFLPRERNEGFGGVDAFMGKIHYHTKNDRISTSFAAGYYKLPDVKNYRLNKYGVPSYTQFNADIRYAFPGIFKGLEAQLLVVGKINNGETYNSKKFEFNKVNMLLYNFVMNYHF